MRNVLPFLAGLVVGAAGAVILMLMLFYVAIHYNEAEEWHDRYDDDNF